MAARKSFGGSSSSSSNSSSSSASSSSSSSSIHTINLCDDEDEGEVELEDSTPSSHSFAGNSSSATSSSSSSSSVSRSTSNNFVSSRVSVLNNSMQGVTATNATNAHHRPRSSLQPGGNSEAFMSISSTSANSMSPSAATSSSLQQAGNSSAFLSRRVNNLQLQMSEVILQLAPLTPNSVLNSSYAAASSASSSVPTNAINHDVIRELKPYLHDLNDTAVKLQEILSCLLSNASAFAMEDDSISAITKKRAKTSELTNKVSSNAMMSDWTTPKTVNSSAAPKSSAASAGEYQDALDAMEEDSKHPNASWTNSASSATIPSSRSVYPAMPVSSASSFSSSSSSSSSSASTQMETDEELARRLAAEWDGTDEKIRRERRQKEEEESLKAIQAEYTCSACLEIREADMQKLSCSHNLCFSCVRKHVRLALANADRLGKQVTATQIGKNRPIDFYCCSKSVMCSTLIPDFLLRKCLTETELNRVNDLVLHSAMDGSTIVRCPSCRTAFEGVAGRLQENGRRSMDSSAMAAALQERGLDGQPLSQSSLQHRAKYRYRCRCETIFCSGCQAAPYHSGFTCEEYKRYQTAKKCRFCEKALTEQNMARAQPSPSPTTRLFGILPISLSSASSPPLPAHNYDDVCNDSECIAKRQICCENVFKDCGHRCCGLKAELNCLGCLVEGCPNRLLSPPPKSSAAALIQPEWSSAPLSSASSSSFSSTAFEGIKGDEFCAICFTESLSAAPCVRLSICGHVFHHACVIKKLQKSWTGARITFGFLNCVLCREVMDHPVLLSYLKPMLEMRQQMEEKSEERLRLEGLDKEKALTSPESRYYKKPKQYAMDRLAYYKCSKCEKPFFGGRRQCEEVKDQSADEKFKPEELVCGGCSAGSNVAHCAKHGKDYIEFKCKFCCGVANFFCWGSVHFCDSCHQMQVQGNYVTKKKVEDLPKCPGREKCPLGIEHLPAGQEQALGCAICRPRYSAI